MALKVIVFVSFALTGTLFYLSKNGKAAHPAKAEAVEPLAMVDTPKAAETKHKKSVKLVQTMPAIESYASLMPTGAIQPPVANSKTPDFLTTAVGPTLQSCYKDLVQRRKEIWKARRGETELSFVGELELTARFNEGKVNFVQSRSSEVRDEKFHNCMETGMKQWKFPQSVALQPEWNYRTKIAYDVNYSHDCKASTYITSLTSFKMDKCL